LPEFSGSANQKRKNSAKPKKWPSMIRNVSLVNGQTDRLALPYRELILVPGWRDFSFTVRITFLWSCIFYVSIDLVSPPTDGHADHCATHCKNISFHISNLSTLIVSSDIRWSVLFAVTSIFIVVLFFSIWLDDGHP
jgi:hypothetical protein